MNKYFRHIVRALMVLLVFVFLSACGGKSDSPSSETNSSAKRTELLVSAAASLTDALNDIRKLYEQKNPDVTIALNFGASGSLQQQIEQGAPADLFFSAAPQNMNQLLLKQLIDKSYMKTVLQNELVVVVPKAGKTNLKSLADLGRSDVKTIAVGIPESVPAGAYAKEALTGAKLWDSLFPKIVQGKDVRQVLAYVETGNADAGFVYRTDAAVSDKVNTAFTVEPGLYKPILYPLGIVRATKHPQQSKQLFAFLQSEEALELFRRHGFSAAGLR